MKCRQCGNSIEYIYTNTETIMEELLTATNDIIPYAKEINTLPKEKIKIIKKMIEELNQYIKREIDGI